MPTPPTLTDTKSYLGYDNPDVASRPSWSDADVLRALEAEIAAQKAACKFPPDPALPAEPLPYPKDLKEALFRRVSRNLNMKPLPLGYQNYNTEFGTVATRVGSDPEVRRLEAPHRRLVVG